MNILKEDADGFKINDEAPDITVLNYINAILMILRTIFIILYIIYLDSLDFLYKLVGFITSLIVVLFLKLF